MEAPRVHAGRNRDDAPGRHARADDDGAHGLATRDHTVGEPIDERPAGPDPDRDVAATHHGTAERPGGQGAEPAVHGTVGVDQAHGARLHEPAQHEERQEIVGAAHPDRDRRDPGGPGLGVERARGLTRDQRVPAVVEEPARLGQDPELLAAEPARRLRVQDRRHGDRLPLSTRSREKADVGGCATSGRRGSRRDRRRHRRRRRSRPGHRRRPGSRRRRCRAPWPSRPEWSGRRGWCRSAC